jgi:tryptophan 2-C-methyltransferase
MNVLLVNTNRMKPAVAPIGLDYLADSLLAAGHEVQLLDLCFAEDVSAEINRALRAFAPAVIGVTIRNTDDCYFSGQAFFLPDIKEIIASLRRVSEAPVVLGGVGFSVAPVAVLEFCEADFGLFGEGERAAVELLHALERRSDFSRILNLVYREGSAIRQNPSVPVVLPQLPPRRRALVDNALYFRKGGQAGFETKRGCRMECVYCADPVAKGRAVRLLPPPAVVAELSALVGQGIDHFHTCDSEFNLPPEHAQAVCRAILEAGLGERIRWYAYCAPTPFDDAMAGLFKRAGCAGIDFGADSGSREMLRRLGRHFAPADLVRTAQVCHRHAIPFMYDLLLGGPGETPETLRETIDLMRRVEADCVGLSLGMRIYAGTPMAGRIQGEGGPASHPNVHGAKLDNPHWLKPVFYLSPQVGEDLPARVRQLVAGDPRFFLPEESPQNRNYNYSDNVALVQAIENGARGAYWNILRQRG